MDANDQAEADNKRRTRDSDGHASDEGAARAAKGRAVNVSLKEDPNAKRAGGGPMGQSNEAREKMMASQREAEAEPWQELNWRTEDNPATRKAFNNELFAEGKQQLWCTNKPADYIQNAMRQKSTSH